MKEIAVPKKWITITGGVGFGLLILTFGIYAVTSAFALYVKIPMAIGAAGVLIFWILSAIVSRSARYGSNAFVMVLLAFLILIMVNFVSARRFGRIDTTKGKQFSLSEQTVKILKDLKQDVNVTAFYTEDHYRQQLAEDLLTEYSLQSGKFHLNFIDPNLKPGLAMNYNIKQNGTVVFEIGDRREDVVSHQNEEQDFTSAILKLLATEKKKLYFLDGHGEKDIDGNEEDSYSELKRMIEAENYAVEKILLAGRPSIPADCSVLVIAGPEKPLFPQETETINRYMDRGGKAIIMADPTPSPSLANILERWGIEVRDDIILDSVGQNLGDPSIPAATSYGDHPITIPIAMARVMTFFPMARSLAPAKKPAANLEVTELVKTGKDSWGEVDTEELLTERVGRLNEGRDIEGPLCMAVAVISKEKTGNAPPPVPGQMPEEETKENRVLVAVGDSDFVTNKWFQSANPDLFMNSVNWLAEEEELISIRPKDVEQARIERITDRQLRLVTYTSIFAIPIILLMAGGLVWWKRR